MYCTALSPFAMHALHRRHLQRATEKLRSVTPRGLALCCTAYAFEHKRAHLQQVLVSIDWRIRAAASRDEFLIDGDWASYARQGSS